MSGLFGANAVRSPLSDVPSFKGRTAHQLEAVIDVALGPHAYQTASQVLGALDPITPVDGFTAAVTIDRNTPHANEILRVLNAGTTIGAVRTIDTGDEAQSYQVRAELFEYLSIAAKREFEKDKSHGRLAELERTISVALLPDIKDNAEMILSHLDPIEEQGGYIAEINIDKIEKSDAHVVRRALNAGTAHKCVRRSRRTPEQPDDAIRYRVNSEFFKALVAIRGRLLLTGTAPTVLPALPPESAPPPAEAAERPETGATPPNAADDAASTASTPSRQPSEGVPHSEAAPDVSLVDQAETADRDDWDRLVEAIGIDPDMARACLEDDAIEKASREVSRALQRQEKSNSRLKQHIARLRKEAEDRVSDEYNTMSAVIPKLGPRLEQLRSERERVEQNLDTLLMFPGSGLIEHLIESIEAAAGDGEGLSAGEQELKNALSAIREHVSEMDVSSKASWELYAHKINELPDAKPHAPDDGPLNVVGFPSDPSRRPSR